MKPKSLQFLPYVLYGLVGLLLIVIKIGHYPLLWYDEGARLIVSRTLSEAGLYASYSTEGFIPFNPWISAGPLDVLSVAGMLSIFGKQVSVIRLAMVPFDLLSMFLILVFAQRLFGKAAGWLGALLVLAVPPMLDNSFILMSRQFMSENTSTAMALVGMYLWYRSWKTGKQVPAWLGGALLGLGMISKTQAAIWLMPALALVWLLRTLQNWKRSLKEIGFLISASLVIIAWYLFVNLQVPAEMQQSNWQSMRASVQTLLFTVEKRQLNTTTIVLAAVMYLATLVTLVDLVRKPKESRLSDPDEWGKAMLAIAGLFCVTWFFFLSIRYPRYTYTGWIFTMMLAGWWLYRIEMWVSGLKIFKTFKLEKWLLPVTLLGLIGLIVAGHGLPLLRIHGPVAVEETGKFIDANISPDAVIETTEMEVFGLTDHWEFHFAPNEVILAATRRNFYDPNTPVNYEFLAGDPDYLVTGAFSDWIGLYWDSGLVESDFVKLAEFPPYQVFQRKR